MAKIGFVVPVYKVREELLRSCIDSLVNQTCPDIEIIIVDDCSPDDCGKICDELANKDTRIKVIHHEKNKGLPGARNTGIDNSEAEYLAFIDGDDWVELNMAEVLLGEIERYNADVFVYSGFREFKNRTVECTYIYDQGKCFLTSDERNEFQHRYLFDQTKKHVPGSFAIQSACIKLVSRKLFEKGLHFIDVKFAEDALFHLYSSEYAQRIVYLQHRFYHYRDTSDSMVNSYRPNADVEQISVLKEMWKFAEIFGKNDDFKKGIYLLSFVSMQMCVWQKYYNEKNTEPIQDRKKACKTLFSTYPYKGVLSKVSFWELRDNQKVKYILMCMRAYKLIVRLRNQHNQNNKKESQ